MRHIRKYIIGSLALPLLLFSCTDNGLSLLNPSGGSANGGMVRTELSISTPAALSASLTRAVSAEKDSTLNGNFAVFGFDSEEDTLIFVLKTDSLAASSTTYGTGDMNTESNLNGENQYAETTDTEGYGDYTESPSIAWHPADETNSSGRLYIEYWETPDPVHLLVLSNVDSTAIAALLTETTDETTGESTAAITTGMKFDAVTAALAPALDYAVKDTCATYEVSVVGNRYGIEDDNNPTPKYIPMAGECTLANGITLGSTGSIKLRRSVAKMSFNFSWTTDYYGEDSEGHVNLSDTVTVGRDFDENPRKFKVFIPDTVRIVNLYRYATVYAGPSTETGEENTEANYSTLNYSENSTTSQIDTIKYDATIPITADDFYYDEEGNMHVSVDFLLAETKNTCMDAYVQSTPGGDFEPYAYPRVSILVCGTYYDTDVDTDGTLSREGWYRMDLIPDDGGYNELGEILRNHHYKFEIVDPTKRPSSDALNAFELSVPDNYRSGGISSLVVIDDEDYVSITADSDYGDENGVPYYIAVSATYVDLERSEGACALVKMETNYYDDEGNQMWSIDESEIPVLEDRTSEGQMVYAFDIVYDSNAKTIYVWLDWPGYVEEDKTYAYYIVAGNIRKKMRIHIVEGDYVDDTSGGGGTP